MNREAVFLIIRCICHYNNILKNFYIAATITAELLPMTSVTLSEKVKHSVRCKT